MGTHRALVTARTMKELRKKVIEMNKQVRAMGLEVGGWDPKCVKRDEKGNLTYVVVGMT